MSRPASLSAWTWAVTSSDLNPSLRSSEIVPTFDSRVKPSKSSGSSSSKARRVDVVDDDLFHARVGMALHEVLKQEDPRRLDRRARLDMREIERIDPARDDEPSFLGAVGETRLRLDGLERLGRKLLGLVEADLVGDEPLERGDAR